MKKCSVVGFAILLVLGFGITQAGASSYTYDLATVFNGVSPTSTPPWLTAVFADTATPGTVTLTLTSHLNVASEFFGLVDFNSSILPSSLSFTQTLGPTASIANTTDNAQDMNGGGNLGKGFDVELSWGANSFNNSDVATFNITYGTTLTADNFTGVNSGGANATVGAHIQGIPVTGGGTTSGAIMNTIVPIPPGVWLLGSGLIGLIGIRRRHKK